MPEGHTIHRLAGELNGMFAGATVESDSPQGRFSAEQVDGRMFRAAEVWGKHLIVSFVGIDQVVHVHLGLFGKWSFGADTGSPVTGQVRWRIRGRGRLAELRGPTACELLDPPEVDALLARLGPDPLRDDADPAVAWSRIRDSKSPLGTLLMRQDVIAGVGAVYRAELLFRHGIDPMVPGAAVDETFWNELWNDLCSLMKIGVQRGRIDTVRPEHEPEIMQRAPREDAHGGEVYVYRRDGNPCHVCGETVRKKVLAGRNLFWCPQCQQRR